MEKPVNLAPDFTVYDAAGKAVQLHDFIGKPIVLNFWASWCGPCRSEMPEFQEVYNQLGDKVTFLMVNAGQESANDVKSFLENAGYTFPVYYDTTDGAAVAYRVTGLPTTYFLNAKGEAVTYVVGAINKDTLRALSKPAFDFQTAHPDKLVWCGEFGTIRHAPLEWRENWMRDVIKILNEWDIPYCVWNYLSTPNDGNRFSLVDDDERKILSEN